ncbi:MAG TPA: tripartite tricarboxylate transporter TctB family protein [Casimicrobiaceae bacterium]|nr:tripartite tricarboxylate transporter TctB family protein [Casimicrobiaceae bacterium]
MIARRRDAAQIAISALLIALALFIFWQVQLIPADGGYSAVGPRFSPLVIAVGLAAAGLKLLYDAFATGWKGMEESVPPEPFFAPAFAWIAGGLVIHMIVIAFVGFTLASTLLFACVARGFGSRSVVRDVIIGFVLAAAVYLFFTRVLNLALPASPVGLI